MNVHELYLRKNIYFVWSLDCCLKNCSTLQLTNILADAHLDGLAY